MSDNFVLDVTRIREKVQERMDQGPSTPSYGPDVAQVVAILNDVVATGVVCWTRYTRHVICASGDDHGGDHGGDHDHDRAQVAAEFREHAAQEMQHALRAAERVSELGGEPRPDPATAVARARIDSAVPDSGELRQVLRDNLLAERVVIEAYREILQWLGDRDPATRRLLESILKEEEEHADDILDLLGH
jgi:bacterioferritin